MFRIKTYFDPIFNKTKYVVEAVYRDNWIKVMVFEEESAAKNALDTITGRISKS